MGAVPEFAPIGVDHLLRSSSVVQKVTYSAHERGVPDFRCRRRRGSSPEFQASRVTAGGAALHERSDTREPGYTLQAAVGWRLDRARAARGCRAKLMSDADPINASQVVPIRVIDARLAAYLAGFWAVPL